MILPVMTLLMVALVPLLGGDLRRMGEVHLRGAALAIVALLAQIAVINVFSDSLPLDVAAALHVATYIPAGMVAVLNWRVPGLPVIAVGGAGNLVAIAANGGVMPATPGALARAGFTVAEAGFTNSTAVADPRVFFLGDIFAVPASWPLSNVFSIGDVLLLIGMAILLHQTCRPGPRSRADVAPPDIDSQAPQDEEMVADAG